MNDGGYKVRGTVRDKGNNKKMMPLMKAYGDQFNKIDIVEADLLKPDSIDRAVEGMEFVVHTASPFPSFEPKNEMELIKPAVDGTVAVMRAAHKHKVKRVVLTSSIASVMMQVREERKEVYNEKDWSNLKACGAYEKSKTMAERAAWDFLHRLPEEERFELVCICPSVVLGPNICESDFTSGAFISKIMEEKFPGMPKVQFNFVDVREVAIAHLQALKVEEAKNLRFLLTNKTIWMKELARILKNRYRGFYKIKDRELPLCPVKLVASFDKSVKKAIQYWKVEYEFDNSRSKEILGIQYRPIEESIIEMSEQMIKLGLIKDKINKKKKK